MKYPIISDYIDSIMSAEENFATLINLRPVLDNEGHPIMSSGNFAVVFKMIDVESRKEYAVKCFTKDQQTRSESYSMISRQLDWLKSPYLLNVHYYEYELFVNTKQSLETDYPVLVMDWVDGLTLDRYIAKNIDNNAELNTLFFRFYQLSKWLISSPIAHGDLKPDNILVTDNGELVLVDYDGMYVPEMKGQEAKEIGSPDYQHPYRTTTEFDEHLDDFSICTILLSLKAIINSPSLYHDFTGGERLLFAQKDYLDLGESGAFRIVSKMLSDSQICTLVSLFLEVYSGKRLSEYSFNRLKISAPNTYVNSTHHFDSIIKQAIKYKKENKYEEYIKLCDDRIKKGMDVGENYFAIYMMHHLHNKHYNTQVKCLEEAVKCGYYDAKLYLAVQLIRAWYPFKQDYNRGVQLLKECLAQKEDSIPIVMLAQCYNEGRGVPRDGNEALRLFTKAANMNNSDAQCILGHWYDHGVFGENGLLHKLGQRQDLNKAIFWFTKASTNSKEACWWLANLYRRSKARNIFLAKHFSDKVNDIQNRENSHSRSFEVIDTFDEREEEYVIFSERKLCIDEINSIGDIKVKTEDENRFFHISCKTISENVSFAITHSSIIKGGKITPAMINVIEYKKKGKYQSYYKLDYHEE
ncbi:MAG: SEL1-like repeat protein [Prevotella sp.]|nr:SEL1-like repeat protein [Candidatus Equicola faecalis]